MEPHKCVCVCVPKKNLYLKAWHTKYTATRLFQCPYMHCRYMYWQQLHIHIRAAHWVGLELASALAVPRSLADATVTPGHPVSNNNNNTVTVYETLWQSQRVSLFLIFERSFLMISLFSICSWLLNSTNVRCSESNSSCRSTVLEKFVLFTYKQHTVHWLENHHIFWTTSL